jgi:hypothetical protein
VAPVRYMISWPILGAAHSRRGPRIEQRLDQIEP